MSLPGSLPVHGMVLAGGLSSRMGRDKALLSLEGVPLVASAVHRLASFCAAVSVVGNREDLQAYAPVIAERRLGFGPVAGLEAGLGAAEQMWALFTPVDVPLVQAGLLRSWAEDVFARTDEGVRVSYLKVYGERQPTFCMLHTAVLPGLAQCAAQQQKRVVHVLETIAGDEGALWVSEAERLSGQRYTTRHCLQTSFLNVNTPEDWKQLQDVMHQGAQLPGGGQDV